MPFTHYLLLLPSCRRFLLPMSRLPRMLTLTSSRYMPVMVHFLYPGYFMLRFFLFTLSPILMFLFRLRFPFYIIILVFILFRFSVRHRHAPKSSTIPRTPPPQPPSLLLMFLRKPVRVRFLLHLARIALLLPPSPAPPPPKLILPRNPEKSHLPPIVQRSPKMILLFLLLPLLLPPNPRKDLTLKLTLLPRLCPIPSFLTLPLVTIPFIPAHPSLIALPPV